MKFSFNRIYAKIAGPEVPVARGLLQSSISPNLNMHVVGGKPPEGSHDSPVSLANDITRVALRTRLLLYYSIIM